MNALTQLELVQTIGVVLAHFLWQGAAIAMILAVALRVLRASTVRYAAATIAMLAMALCPLITAGVMFLSPAPQDAVVAATVAQRQAPIVIDTPIAAGSEEINDTSSLWMSILVSIWFIGVAAMGTRHVVGWLQLRSARATSDPIDSIEWTAPLARMIDALGVNAVVQLAATTRFDSAVAFGVFKPIILVPVSLLSGLSAAQIELILAHELAHIRRRDYLINLLQTTVETILFYHPAVWWVGAVMRREREYCCDDLAAAACGGDRRAYAMTLLELGAQYGTDRATARFAPAMSGYSIVDRAMRLVREHTTNREPVGGLIAMLVIAVTVFTTLAIGKDSADELAAAAASASEAPTTSPASQPATLTFYIGGAVKRAGVYTFSSTRPPTLAEAIITAGGRAEISRVQVISRDGEIVESDVKREGWKEDVRGGGMKVAGDMKIMVGPSFPGPRVAITVDDPDWEKTYRIGRFDLLNIRVTSKDGATPPAEHEARVPESGKVALADVKVDVNAMGLTTRELTDTLLAAFQQGNLNLNVDVKIAEARGNTFIAVGMVGRPGEYMVALGKKLRLSAALQMTGLRDEAKVITILSKNGADSKVIGTYNAADFRKSTPPADDPVIEPGQVIFAGERSPEATQPATDRAPAAKPTTSKADAQTDNARPREFAMEDLAKTDPMMRYFIENRSRASLKQVQLTRQFGATHPSVLVAQRESDSASRMAEEYFADKKPKPR